MHELDNLLDSGPMVYHSEQCKFKKYLLEVQEIFQDNSESIRHYVTDNGKRYPSVTSILGETKSPEDKQKLVDWRKRVGEDVADAILADSIAIGNRLHNECETFLLGDTARSMTIREARMMKPMFRYLRNNVDVVLGIEIPLHSHKYRMAGTCDLVAVHNGVLTVIDFKNSKKYKRKEWVSDYRLQCTMYSMMLEDMYGLRFKKYKILMSVQDGKYLTFEGDCIDHKKDVIDRIVKYHSK